MLVRVTNKCQMQCSHCMVDAMPDGHHMTVGTFKQVLDFVEALGVPMLTLSGGEPTDHPQLFELLELVDCASMMVTLLSNGLFLHEWSPAKLDLLFSKVQTVQVTNDPRYYPKHVPVFEHPKVYWETHLRSMSPFGRALVNKIPLKRQSPLCFNLRSATRYHGSLFQGIYYLRGQGRFCTPSVNIDGTIVAGEAPDCSSIGHVLQDEATLTRNTVALRCNRCKLVENLDSTHRAAIGEHEGVISL